MIKNTLIACGNKMPLWVSTAAQEYSKRLKEFTSFNLIEIPLIKRNPSQLIRVLDKEAALMIEAIPTNSRVIALDVNGETFSSEELALKLEKLSQITSHLSFLIGGPEGLSPLTLAKSHERWSLSSLTLPHPLVRVVLLESLYRAYTIMHNHPYHK